MLRTYRAMLIFLASLTDEDVEKTQERVRSEIARLGGGVSKFDCLGRRTFARPMRKQDTGVYYEMEFTLDPLKIQAFTGRLKLIDEVFRVQISRVYESAPTPAKKAAVETETAPVAEPPPAKPAVAPPAETQPETANEAVAEPAPVESAEVTAESEATAPSDAPEESKNG